MGGFPAEPAGELQRVAEQDEVARRRSNGDRVGKRDLAGLVDHEVVERRVELLAREEPRGAGDEPDLGIEERRDLGLARDQLALERGLVVAVARLLQPSEDNSALRGLALDRPKQVVDHRWLCAVTPTLLPALTSSTTISAPRQVLPVPGGPCTNR